MRLLIAGICVAGLIWIVGSLGPRRLVAVALRADPWWLALSGLAVASRFLVWGHKWSRMLARHAPVPYFVALRYLLAGSFVNLTTPTAKIAGGFVRAALLRRQRDWPATTAYGSALADQITNLLGHIALYGLIAVGLGVGTTSLSGQLRATLLASGALALAGVLVCVGLRSWGWSLLHGRWLGRRVLGLVPARFRGGSEEETLRSIFGPLLLDGGSARFLRDVGWSVLAFAMLPLASALVMRALGVDAPLMLIAAATVVGYFTGMAVGAWGGGVGVTEAALTGLFVQIGVPPEQAAAGALLHRAIFYALVLGWGGWALLRGRRQEA